MYAQSCIHKRRLQPKTSTRLFRQLVETKRAAAEIEDVVVRGYLVLEFAGYRVEPLLALLLDFQEARLSHDPQVFGNVVLRRLQSLGDFVYAQLLLEQQPKDAETALFTKRLKRGNAVESGHAELIQPRTRYSQEQVVPCLKKRERPGCCPSGDIRNGSGQTCGAL